MEERREWKAKVATPGWALHSALEPGDSIRMEKESLRLCTMSRFKKAVVCHEPQ